MHPVSRTVDTNRFAKLQALPLLSLFLCTYAFQLGQAVLHHRGPCIARLARRGERILKKRALQDDAPLRRRSGAFDCNAESIRSTVEEFWKSLIDDAV